MSDLLKELEEWYKSFDNVADADCQIMYYPKGYDARSPRTIMINGITFNDGTSWYDVPERRGGDFRRDLELFIAASKIAFNRKQQTIEDHQRGIE